MSPAADDDGRPVGLLVTDLDNTLYDWVAIWHASFSALLDGLVEISGLVADDLKPEIRRVHQQRRTSEYSHLIQELPSLRKVFPTKDLQEVFAPAIRASREARHAAMRLYPGVLDTLQAVRAAGTKIVAYTESLAFFTSFRLRRLELDGAIDVLYSPQDHEFPDGVTAESMRTLPATEYGLQHTKHRLTPAGHLKPEPEVLTSILEDFTSEGRRVVYVGDSLMKDISMAQTVGVTDVWAVYGQAQHREEYALLREVSHWTDEDVQREKALMHAPDVAPTYRLEHSFAELLDLFRFSA